MVIVKTAIILSSASPWSINCSPPTTLAFKIISVRLIGRSLITYIKPITITAFTMRRKPPYPCPAIGAGDKAIERWRFGRTALRAVNDNIACDFIYLIFDQIKRRDLNIGAHKRGGSIPTSRPCQG